MAINAKLTTKHGIELQDSYINIISMQSSKQVVHEELPGSTEKNPKYGAPVNQYSLRIFAEVYANKQAFADGLPHVDEIERVVALDTEKPIHAQAYDHLMDEFGGMSC